jgi:hypothetical protein
MPRSDFHFAGHAIRVEAPDEPLAWLREFVSPHFTARDAAAPARTVVLAIDPEEHARLAKHGPHPHHLTKPCFTLDSGIVNGLVWNVPEAAAVVRDEERDVFYRRATPEADRIELIARRDDAQVRVALMRAVREYAMLYARRAGWLLLHAAAVSVDGDTFVIAGPKRSGKTTLLLRALRDERGAYVANDRLALHRDSSALVAYGIPTIAIVRKESTQWFGGLDAQLVGAGYHYRHRVADPSVNHEAPAPTSATWSLSPPQFCALLGVESRAAGPVTAVLFPRVDTRPVTTTFEKLDSRQALEAWCGALFRSCPPGGMFAIEEDAAAAPGPTDDELVSSLAALVPSVACRLGPDAYGSGARRLSVMVREACLARV